jgi:hypothetical protein
LDDAGIDVLEQALVVHLRRRLEDIDLDTRIRRRESSADFAGDGIVEV